MDIRKRKTEGVVRVGGVVERIGLLPGEVKVLPEGKA